MIKPFAARSKWPMQRNGYLLLVAHNAAVTMACDKENRQISHTQGATVVTYTYSGDGLKRSEVSSGSTTTLVWDGSEYIGETN